MLYVICYSQVPTQVCVCKAVFQNLCNSSLHPNLTPMPSRNSENVWTSLLCVFNSFSHINRRVATRPKLPIHIFKTTRFLYCFLWHVRPAKRYTYIMNNSDDSKCISQSRWMCTYIREWRLELVVVSRLDTKRQDNSTIIAIIQIVMDRVCLCTRKGCYGDAAKLVNVTKSRAIWNGTRMKFPCPEVEWVTPPACADCAGLHTLPFLSADFELKDNGQTTVWEDEDVLSNWALQYNCMYMISIYKSDT